MKALFAWARNKFGRIVTFIGSLAAGIDVFDVTPLKHPVAELIGDEKLASRILAGVALLCLALSWARHQHVATAVSKPTLPPPDPSAVVKTLVVLCAIAIGVIAPRAYAADAHQFIHFTVYISANTGEVDHYVADPPMSGEKCLKILEGMGGRGVKNGLAQVHFCRAVDAKGVPVPEIKVNPETMQPLDKSEPKPEPPKVST